jgi:hypothetical protein
MDQQAAGAVPGTDHGAVTASLEGVRVIGEGEPTLALVLAVTLEAVLVEHRPDLGLEINAGGWTGGRTAGGAGAGRDPRAGCRLCRRRQCDGVHGGAAHDGRRGE